MAFSGYGGLERREQEKDKAKAALAAQLALMKNGIVEIELSLKIVLT